MIVAEMAAKPDMASDLAWWRQLRSNKFKHIMSMNTGPANPPEHPR